MDQYIKLEDVSFDDIYSYLESSIEDKDQLTIENAGRVQYYRFNILEEKEWNWQADLDIKVERGIHSLIFDTNTRGWIAYQGSGEEA